VHHTQAFRSQLNPGYSPLLQTILERYTPILCSATSHVSNYEQEVFTGKLPYSSCNDGKVAFNICNGILPARPFDKIKDHDSGNQTWELLLKCWGRTPKSRPSALRVRESVSPSLIVYFDLCVY
jgi:hypothetical protein